MTQSHPFTGYCPPVSYSPRGKPSGKTYPDPDPAALRWVTHWEEVHRRTRCEAWADGDSIVEAARQVHTQAGLPPPEHVIIATSPEAALHRWMIDCVRAAPASTNDPEATANAIIEELNRRHTIIFHDVLNRLSARVAEVMESEDVLSSRWLFGPAGATISDEYGSRWDPIPLSFCMYHHQILSQLGDVASSLVEYKNSSGPSAVAPSVPSDLNPLSISMLETLSHLSRIAVCGFPGNLAAGAYRQFAYLQTILANQVDFKSFEPWRIIAENTHVTCMGINSVVICPLPSTLSGDTNGLTSTWDDVEAFCPWSQYSRAQTKSEIDKQIGHS